VRQAPALSLCLAQPYDCTHHTPMHYGQPFLIAVGGGIVTPSDNMYEARDAAIPFGRNTPYKSWVRSHLKGGREGLECQGRADRPGSCETVPSRPRVW
jgi:hypothetical protein